jgi:8-oxo-dGTP diphosphatase
MERCSSPSSSGAPKIDNGPAARLVHVVAGVLRDRGGAVLLAQRLPGKHLAGGWEFPGGKLEPGETRHAALLRELAEEIGVEVRDARPLFSVTHAYPHRDILLDVWTVARYDGVPRGLEGQALRWCAPDDLPRADLLPADRPIVTAIRLPEHLVAACTDVYEITEPFAGAVTSGPAGGARLQGALCGSYAQGVAAVAAGADFLVARAHFARDELATLCTAAGVPVYLAGRSLAEAWELGAVGSCEPGIAAA